MTTHAHLGTVGSTPPSECAPTERRPPAVHPSVRSGPAGKVRQQNRNCKCSNDFRTGPQVVYHRRIRYRAHEYQRSPRRWVSSDRHGRRPHVSVARSLAPPCKCTDLGHSSSRPEKSWETTTTVSPPPAQFATAEPDRAARQRPIRRGGSSRISARGERASSAESTTRRI